MSFQGQTEKRTPLDNIHLRQMKAEVNTEVTNMSTVGTKDQAQEKDIASKMKIR